MPSVEPFLKRIKENEKYQNEILKLVLSYYNTADAIRPYIALFNIIRYYNIKKLDSITLQNILANTKEDILLLDYDKNAFVCQSKKIQAKINRSISYIHNFLKTALAIDEHYNIIIDFRLIDRLENDMNAMFYMNNQRLEIRAQQENKRTLVIVF